MSMLLTAYGCKEEGHTRQVLKCTKSDKVSFTTCPGLAAHPACWQNSAGELFALLCLSHLRKGHLLHVAQQ